MGIREKIETVGWFLRRPGEYTEFPRFMWHRYRGPLKGWKTAHPWCRKRAVFPDEALQQLTGSTLPRLSPGTDADRSEQAVETLTPRHEFPQLVFAIEELHPDIFAEAQQVIVGLPVDMGGPAILDVLYGLVRHSQPVRIVETGIGNGWSALSILLACQGRPEARLISTDMIADKACTPYVGSAVPQSLCEPWRQILHDDRTAIPQILAEWPRIDFCHYDSDKSYQGRMWASRLLWQALRPGGFFVLDDICDNFAYRDFCVEVRRTPLVVCHSKSGGKFAGVLVK